MNNGHRIFWAILIFCFLITGCIVATNRPLTPGQLESRMIQDKLDSLPLYDSEGHLVSAGASSSSSSLTVEAAAAEIVAELEALENSSAALEEPAVTKSIDIVADVLVDQDYAGTFNTKGLSWIKAIQAKKISGTSSFAQLHIQLSRNGNTNGFETLGLYVAPLDPKGNVIPSLEWRHVRYIDAEHLHNTRALAAGSNLSTLGVEEYSAVYDLDALPTTKECDYSKKPAFCPAGSDTHDFLNAFKETAFYIGFLPSRSTAHVKVTLIHDGGLTVTPAVK